MASAGERPGPLEGKHVHRSRLLAATALTVTTLAASALVAVAQPATAAPAQTFAIEAGPLNAALIAYAAQSGRQILFQPQQVEGRAAPALMATMSANTALAKLLEGTGLVAVRSGPNVFVLRAASSPAGADQSRGPGDPHARDRETGEAPAAASTTHGVNDVSIAGSKKSRFSPLSVACRERSKSPRLWIPSSSFQPNGKRYSTSIARFA